MIAHVLPRITQDMSQHHHKQNYMWLNVCDLPEKNIILAKKTSKKCGFLRIYLYLCKHI